MLHRSGQYGCADTVAATWGQAWLGFSLPAISGRVFYLVYRYPEAGTGTSSAEFLNPRN